MTESVLIVGAGPGLSASLTRLCSKRNMKVILAARNIKKLKNLSEETGATLKICDASEIDSIKNLFKELDQEIGTPNLVIYNPSARVRGPIQDLDPIDTKKALEITSFGAFLVAQQAAQRMLKRGSRELHPKNIHIAHFVIDGGIRSNNRPERVGNGQDNMLEPDAIAETYLQFYDQHKSAWAWETELRPWIENF